MSAFKIYLNSVAWRLIKWSALWIRITPEAMEFRFDEVFGLIRVIGISKEKSST